MNDDPFAQTVNVNAEGPTPEDVVVSFRPYDSNSAPTITVRGKTWPEVADKLGAMEAGGAGAIIGNAHAALKATYAAATGLGATPTESPTQAQQGYQQGYQQNGAQQAAQGQPQQVQQQGPPPGVQAPTCPHGVKKYVQGGVSKTTGKQYGAFWGCPAPQGTPGQCKPQWA